MINETKWQSIDVKAEITLLPSEESGRKTGITSGYRPNHNFGSAENMDMRMGQITVPQDQWIEPGKSKDVYIQFLMPDDQPINLVTGLTWRIQEGGRHVGNGKILLIISTGDSNSKL